MIHPPSFPPSLIAIYSLYLDHRGLFPTKITD